MAATKAIYYFRSMDAGRLTLTVSDISRITDDVTLLTLATPDGSIPHYRAGQFISFVFSSPAGEVRRAYSLTGSPLMSEPLQIAVKRVPNGFISRRLTDNIRAGATLNAVTPQGLFTLPEDPAQYSQIFLFAAGIGITPIYSIIKTALLMSNAPPMVLVYSNHSPETTVFYRNLLALESSSGGRLRIMWLFSNSADISRARLSSALMPRIIQEYADGPLHTALCYTCGPAPYMWMVSTLLHQYGLPLAAIRKEIFTPAPHPVATAALPDTGTHMVTITASGSTHTISVPYPINILDAALRAGLALPYSCKSGQCGSCVARCTAGTVWQGYNEVLTDSDISAGLVLTCTAHPVSDNPALMVGKN